MELRKALNGIDKKNKKLYSTLTEKEKKDFSPWLLMRYTSNIKEGPWRLFYHHLVMTNEFVNVHFSDLRKHKELQWLLLQLVGTGKNFFHEFVWQNYKHTVILAEDVKQIASDVVFIRDHI